MKSFTDLEQAKRLADILPIESADMCYLSEESLVPKVIYNGMAFFDSKEEKLTNIIYCWSLTALLDIIPWCQVNRMTNSNKWEASSWKNSNIVSEYYVEGFDTPVDACVELIEKLHGLKIL